MKNNILVKTNLLVCIVVVIGFLLTAALSYRSNFSASLEKIEQISDLTSAGIYHQMSVALTRPVDVSQTIAHDSLLREFLAQEQDRLDDAAYIAALQEYLDDYRQQYGYDAVFLASAATGRYYTFDGVDRVLSPDDPASDWYFDELQATDAAYSMNVDNDEARGSGNAVTLFVNSKIQDETGKLWGAVGVGTRLHGLQSMLQAHEEQFGVNAYLIDEAGNLVISTAYAGYEAINLFGVEESASARAEQEILSWRAAEEPLSLWLTDAAGRKQDYLVTRYLPALRWHLIVERDTSALSAHLRQQLLVTLLVIGGILAAILVILTSVIRRFNRQIVALTQSVEQERRELFEQATEQLFENIYEVDVTRDVAANRATAAYFESMGAPAGASYESALAIIAEKQVMQPFRQTYLETFSRANVMRTYEQGGQSLSCELRITRDGSHYYWIRIMGRIVKCETDDSVRMLVYRQNIDAEKRRESRMLELAQTDEMTGLLTKTATRRRIETLLAEHPGERFAYLILDIDDFKQANDRFGHAFGDSVICAFSRVIRERFRKEDVVGRVGGDEFVVFARGGDRVWAAEKAEALCSLLHFTHSRDGASWQLSASIGIALAPEHGTDAATLYRNADAALYQTKARGKNGYTLFDGQDASR